MGKHVDVPGPEQAQDGVAGNGAEMDKTALPRLYAVCLGV